MFLSPPPAFTSAPTFSFSNCHECLPWVSDQTSPGLPPSLPLVFPQSPLHITPLPNPLHGVQMKPWPPYCTSRAHYVIWPRWPSFSPEPKHPSLSCLRALALAGRLAPLQAGWHRVPSLQDKNMSAIDKAEARGARRGQRVGGVGSCGPCIPAGSLGFILSTTQSPWRVFSPRVR